MMINLNNKIQNWIPFLIPLSVIIGILFNQTGERFLFLVSWLLAFMTFTSSLGMKFKNMNSFLKHPFIILFSITFLHIIMPVWVYFLSTIILDDYLLVIGFVIFVIIPTGVTSIIWVTICQGNLPLCLSIILIDSLISPFLIPGILFIAFGEIISIDMLSIMLNLMWMIILPTLIGILLNESTQKSTQDMLKKKLAPLSKLSLLSIVMINSSVIAPYLDNITWETILTISLVFLISASSYIITFTIGHILWKDVQLITTFVFTGGMRNIALGIILATNFFPPKSAIPVVFSMLFQQVLASIFSKIMNKYNFKYKLRVNTS